MKEENNQHVVTRRKFIESASAMTVLSVLPGYLSGSALRLSLPDTLIKGVQIGVIAPFSFRGLPGSVDDVLGYLIKLGITTVELMSAPIELFAGAPTAPPRPQVVAPPAGAPATGGFQRAPLTPEQQAAQDKYTADLKTWRLSVPMTKFEELRKKYSDAGVTINLIKFDPLNRPLSDEEINYCFKVAKALGVKGITTTMALDKGKILGPFADKHKMWVGFHNQLIQIPDEIIDALLSSSNYLGLNLDVGHYFGENNKSPIPVIKKYKNRIISLHLTDRKSNNGPSMPFGEGETPIKEILQLCSEQKYPFGADIDLDYQVPAGSDGMVEVAKCVQYCRDALK